MDSSPYGLMQAAIKGTPRPRGRPPMAPDAARTARYELRLTHAQRDKLERLGGADWLRDRIDRAQPRTPGA